ncbi:hypothetical protein DY000_02020628 [Brassica cretica]|uniref:Uncharacterized protein n=1 Tax=Brassica cretica TaxID=69181 RepID=A0ABQ7EA20_BRACR|nr:hypothetical protein DY000_02020628 [Brassica cretica]
MSAVAAGELSGKLPPPSVVAADDSAESTRLINSVDSVNRWFDWFKLIAIRLGSTGRLELFETDTETDFCMEVQPTLVDRLHCSLRMSINRLQAVSEHYLELSFVVGPVLCPGPWTSGWHPIPHWAIPLSFIPPSSPFQVR